MTVPNVIVEVKAWQSNARLAPIIVFDFGRNGDFYKYNLPFLEWQINPLDLESVVGFNNGIDYCKYIITQSNDLSQFDVINYAEGSIGSICSIVYPIGYWSGAAVLSYDEIDGYDLYDYDYIADGSVGAGCNFEVSLADSLNDGLWYLYAIARSKNGIWGAIE